MEKFIYGNEMRRLQMTVKYYMEMFHIPKMIAVDFIDKAMTKVEGDILDEDIKELSEREFERIKLYVIRSLSYTIWEYEQNSKIPLDARAGILCKGFVEFNGDVDLFLGDVYNLGYKEPICGSFCLN